VALKKSPVELRQVLDAAVETARPLIDARQHRLSLDIESLPVMLFADPVRLTQVVSNLLTNAAKYTDPGGTIELRARTSPDGLVLSIKDDGLGIDAELRARIFEMFEQAHSERSRVDGGLGIGLALAKAYVQMHGGTIDVASEGRGRGSEFTVMLPATILASTRGAGQEEARTDAAFAAAPPASSSAPAAIPPAPAVRRVLVADDNRDAAESVALLLTTAGYEVYTAFDGPEALEKVRRLQPDVALLDIGMPGLNGFSVAQHIRSSPWGGHVRLIALTGWGHESDKRQAESAGFDEHLTKPVDPSQLERLLAEYTA
jgi:CheY-like chemotaxis protein